MYVLKPHPFCTATEVKREDYSGTQSMDILWVFSSSCGFHSVYLSLCFKSVLKITSRAWEDYRMVILKNKRRKFWWIEESNVDFGETCLKFEHFQTLQRAKKKNHEEIFIRTSASERSIVRIWTKKDNNDSGIQMGFFCRYVAISGMSICLLMSLTDWSSVNINYQ